MSCGRPHETPCSELIVSAYVDGEVSTEEYRLTAIHIAECPPCEQQERTHRAMKALVVRAVGELSAPVELHTRIRARLTVALQDPRRDES